MKTIYSEDKYPLVIKWHYNGQFWTSKYFKYEVCNSNMYDDEEHTILMYAGFQVDNTTEGELIIFDHIE